MKQEGAEKWTWTIVRREKGWTGWAGMTVEPPEPDSDLVWLRMDRIAWTRDVDGQPVPPPEVLH
jgi:hypothetical protein